MGFSISFEVPHPCFYYEIMFVGNVLERRTHKSLVVPFLIYLYFLTMTSEAFHIEILNYSTTDWRSPGHTISGCLGWGWVSGVLQWLRCQVLSTGRSVSGRVTTVGTSTFFRGMKVLVLSNFPRKQGCPTERPCFIDRPGNHKSYHRVRKFENVRIPLYTTRRPTTSFSGVLIEIWSRTNTDNPRTSSRPRDDEDLHHLIFKTTHFCVRRWGPGFYERLLY